MPVDADTIPLVVFLGEILAKASLAFFHSGFSSDDGSDLLAPGGEGGLSPGTGGWELY
jgi:hypothetical protein